MAKEHKRKIVIAQSTTKFRMAALRARNLWTRAYYCNYNNIDKYKT